MAVGALLLTACGASGEQEEASDDSDRLYHESLTLIASYTDSLRNAPDSTAVNEKFQRFQQELDSLNRTVAPDTDLLLTEGENDTLYMRLTSLVELYNSRLKVLEQPGDSVDNEKIVERGEEIE